METDERQFTAEPPAYTSCGQPVPPRANPLYGPGSRSALRAAGRVVKRTGARAIKAQQAAAALGPAAVASEEDDEEGKGDDHGEGSSNGVKKVDTIRPYSRKKGCGWTKEEDKLLTDAVAICAFSEGLQRLIADGDVSGQWSRIAERIPERSSKVCRKRWFFCLNPAVRKGPFTAQEDAQLIALFKVHGPAWALIALSIPGRTDDSCAKRYRECLDPSILRGSWSANEDAVLREGVGRYGSQWSQICLMPGLEGRKGLHCRNRWRTLSKDIEGRPGKRKVSNDATVENGRNKKASNSGSISPSPSSSTSAPIVFSPASCQRLTDLLSHQSPTPAATPIATPDDAAIQSLLSALAKEWANSTGSSDPLASSPAPSAVPTGTKSLEAFCQAIGQAAMVSTSQIHSEPHARFVPDALWDAISKSLSRPVGLPDLSPDALAPQSPRSAYLPSLLNGRTDLSATLPYLDLSTLPNFAVRSPSPATSPEAWTSASATASPPSHNKYLDDAFLSRILADDYSDQPAPPQAPALVKEIPSAPVKFDWLAEHQNGLNPLWDAWMTGISQPPNPAPEPMHAPVVSSVTLGQTPVFDFSPWLATTPLPSTED